MPPTDHTILIRTRQGMSFKRIAQIYGVSERYVAAIYTAAKGLPTAFPSPKREEKQRAKCPAFFEMPVNAQDIALQAKVNNGISLDAIFKPYSNNQAAALARRQFFYNLARKLGWSVPTIAIYTHYSEQTVRNAIKDHCWANNLSKPASCRTNVRRGNP